MKKGTKKKPSSDRTILITTTVIVTLVAISPLLFSLATPIFFSGGFIVGEPPECNDGLDNDFDGAKDFNDGDCFGLCDDGTACELDLHCVGIGTGKCNLACDDVCATEDQDWDDECPNDHVIFRLSSEFNAHVGRDRDNPQVAYYPYSICRQLTLNTKQECDGTNMVIRLSSEDDAHIEKKTANAYEGTGFDVCYGEFECVYANTCDTANGFECIATIAPQDPDNLNTNMMVGACEGQGAFDQKICCKDNAMFVAATGITFDMQDGGKIKPSGPKFPVAAVNEIPCSAA